MSVAVGAPCGHTKKRLCLHLGILLHLQTVNIFIVLSQTKKDLCMSDVVCAETSNAFRRLSKGMVSIELGAFTRCAVVSLHRTAIV